MRSAKKQAGFTLIELLVVVGIIGVLVGLSMPAVQAAREAARRAQCGNNLRQIGIALEGYNSSNGCYPPNATQGVDPRTGLPIYLGFYSLHTRLLPYLDAVPLYDAINFATGTQPPIEGVVTVPNMFNSTYISTRLAVFLCPSDSVVPSWAGNSYRGNIGLGPGEATIAEYPDSDNGFFLQYALSRPSYIVDGLSHTAAFSERLTGSGRRGQLVPQRDVWSDPTIGVSTSSGTADSIIQACRIWGRADNQSGYENSGQSWFWTWRAFTLYTHAQTPNGAVPDCGLGGLDGMVTARSWHPGGVNVLMGDGSVRFARDSVSQAVWRGLGTRNGRELVD